MRETLTAAALMLMVATAGGYANAAPPSPALKLEQFGCRIDLQDAIGARGAQTTYDTLKLCWPGGRISIVCLSDVDDWDGGRVMVRGVDCDINASPCDPELGFVEATRSRLRISPFGRARLTCSYVENGGKVEGAD